MDGLKGKIYSKGNHSFHLAWQPMPQRTLQSFLQEWLVHRKSSYVDWQ